MKMLLSVFKLVLILAVGDLVSDMSNGNLLVLASSQPGTTSNIGTTTSKSSSKKKKSDERSTSSDSNDRKDSDKGNSKSADESLQLTSDTESSKNDDDRNQIPKSTEERHGWRKWHRKCTPCLEDEKKKWRSPDIQWICGAYQTARRSFKSPCVMRLRNCQDGTMFVKIHDHRCKDNKEAYGKHFFYDYKVRLTDESVKTSESLKTSTEEEDTSSSSVASGQSDNRRAGSIAKHLILNATAFSITAAKVTTSNDTLAVGTADASGRQNNSIITRQPLIVQRKIIQPKS